MGKEDVVEPPKKKLKQAQLSFCSTPPHLKNKSGLKRKLNNETLENGMHFKIVRRENSSPDREEKKVTDPDVVSLIDDSSDGSEARPTKSPSKNDVNNINKTECVPSREGKENKENIVFSGKDIATTNNVEETSFSLCLDIDSVLPNDNEDNTKKDESEVKEGVADNEELNTSVSDSKKDLDCSAGETEDKNDLNLTADTSMKTNSSSDDETAMLSPSPDQNKSPKTPKRMLTPKQLMRKAESEKKRQEKERIKQEKKDERAKMKEERLKKLTEKKDEKRREKEEKEKKRQAEIIQKTEEKRLKEEERRKKDEVKGEEKKKKEEAKLIEQRKNSQARAAFESFFVPRKSNVTPEKVEQEEIKEVPTKFMPFPVKQDMRLASVTRATLNEEEKQKLKELCCGATEKPNEIVKELYLQELKNGKHKPKCSEATWPLSAWQEEQHDVIIVESVGDEMDQKECTEDKTMKKTCYCAKLLQFHDNRRPPYWGTWRKKSKYISSRRPFSKDKEFFDYEVDSDSEWEDEEEGESLEGGDDADKEQSDEEEGVGENGYLLDNTFVPHGYLSDEEAQAKDEDISPEEQKLRMIILKEEFDEEMNQKAERLKPRLLGCIWISNEITDVGPGSHYEKLLIYRAVWDESSGPIDLQGLSCESPSPPTVPKKPFPQSVVEPLVKLVHGSQLPLSKLVNEFLTQLEKENPTQCVTKGAVTRKIKDIARRSYDRNGKQAWAVNADFCSEFGLKNISGDINSSPSATSPNNIGKPKKPPEGTLVSFLKGDTPKSHQKEAAKKRAQLITLSKAPSAEVIDLTEGLEAVPKPAVVAKKRVPLITLTKTPDTSKRTTVKHKDTPRPAFNPFSHFCKTTPKEADNDPSTDDSSEKKITQS